MTIANALATLALSFWGFMSYAGILAYRSIASQHAPGYPDAGQINIYITVPIALTCLELAGVVIVNRQGRGAVALALVSGSCLMFAPMYLVVWSGGI